MAANVVHFEMPIDEPDRALDVYRAVFGWNPTSWGRSTTGRPPRTMARGSPGHRAQRSADVPAVLVSVDVVDIRVAFAAVEAAGGTRLAGPAPIPTVGWAAHVRDTEGNRIGLFPSDASA